MGQEVLGGLKETEVQEVLKVIMDFLECQGEMARMERKENLERREVWVKRESQEIMVFLDFLVSEENQDYLEQLEEEEKKVILDFQEVVDPWDIKALKVTRVQKVRKGNKDLLDLRGMRENLGNKDYQGGLEIMEKRVHRVSEEPWDRKERKEEVVCLVKLDLEDYQVLQDPRVGKGDKAYLVAQGILDLLD